MQEIGSSLELGPGRQAGPPALKASGLFSMDTWATRSTWSCISLGTESSSFIDRHGIRVSRRSNDQGDERALAAWHLGVKPMSASRWLDGLDGWPGQKIGTSDRAGFGSLVSRRPGFMEAAWPGSREPGSQGVKSPRGQGKGDGNVPWPLGDLMLWRRGFKGPGCIGMLVTGSRAIQGARSQGARVPIQSLNHGIR